MKNSTMKYRSRQHGQAMVEMVVIGGVMISIFLGIWYLGKFHDIQYSAIQAARYTAWERTAHSAAFTDATLQAQTRCPSAHIPCGLQAYVLGKAHGICAVAASIFEILLVQYALCKARDLNRGQSIEIVGLFFSHSFKLKNENFRAIKVRCSR
ncbi:TadE family protein [Undibacterium parvum]|uniref:Pilus assembly protein n=2 Tax=Undibacterium TaxID=401469 RepID=A0A6M4A5L2_9BURK|nr:TadE family protein [Undibacterium parvum]AZP11383.1 pilus assembly protein [Undibacterium parvum]QJQ05867.1 pilus assembly protein [Undibacterium piscinae]